LIFDKSALERLSLDETNWLDNFFYTVITLDHASIACLAIVVLAESR
jgi:hypothetical protein